MTINVIVEMRTEYGADDDKNKVVYYVKCPQFEIETKADKMGKAFAEMIKKLLEISGNVHWNVTVERN